MRMAESSEELGDRDTGCESAEPAAKKKKTKFTGSFLYKTKFSEEWKKTWPFVTAVPGSPHSFRCNVCAKNLSCGHQGAADVKDHIVGQSHQKLAKTLATQPRLSFTSADPLQDKVSSKFLFYGSPVSSHHMQEICFLCQVTRAEVKIANFMVEHNVPFAVADHLSPLLRDVFPDSQIAKRYSSARTKTTSMLNLAIAPHFQGKYQVVHELP